MTPIGLDRISMKCFVEGKKDMLSSNRAVWTRKSGFYPRDLGMNASWEVCLVGAWKLLVRWMYPK